MKIGARVIASVAAAAALTAPVLAAPPAQASPFGCYAIANVPYVDTATHSIKGTGTGYCTSQAHPAGEEVSVTVTVMEYSEWWFDTELASSTRTGTTVTTTASYQCGGNGHTEVYTKVNVRGVEKMSRNVTAYYCS